MDENSQRQLNQIYGQDMSDVNAVMLAYESISAVAGAVGGGKAVGAVADAAEAGVKNAGRRIARNGDGHNDKEPSKGRGTNDTDDKNNQPPEPPVETKNISRTEQVAKDELSARQSEAPDAHFLDRHGPETTLEQQRERARTGLTPEGKQLRPVDAGRFLNNEDMFDALQRAEATFARTGESQIDIEFDRIMGEGYLRGGDVYARTNTVRFIFRDGKPYTFFPLLDDK